MTRPTYCPQCASRYAEIHGLLYAMGEAVGVPCKDSWHRGETYDPNILNLTEEDRQFLADQCIKI